MRVFVFVTLVTIAWHVLTDRFAYGIRARARARLINRCSECDADHALPGRQFSQDGLIYRYSQGDRPQGSG